MTTPPEDEPKRPVLRVVRGDASPEDIAVLTALMAAGGDDRAPEPRRVRGSWSDPVMLARRRLAQGPGAWRSSYR
ncbi:acyl-CoA carboxylase subunit epsilon [Jatrophihabitans fulvus]